MYAEFAQLRTIIVPAEGADTAGWVRDVVQQTFRFALRHRTAVRLTTRDAVERGIPVQQQVVLAAALQAGVAALAGRSPLPEDELRLSLRSLSWLLIRYVLASEAELALIIGQPLSGDALTERVADHLGRMAVAAVL